MYIDSGYGKSKSDNTGILIGAKILNNVYVKKAYNVNLEFPDLIKKIAELFISHNCRIIRIEPKASGISIVQQLKRQTNLAVAELPHKKDDKETCLNSVSPLIESGRLIMIEDISNDIIINQLTKFPNYGEDEFVDLVYYILSGNIGKGFNYKML
jgi:predicted phage terminase large subunit-like protein